MFSKVFEELVNNRIVDHVEKFSLFTDFQYGFRSSHSTQGGWPSGLRHCD